MIHAPLLARPGIGSEIGRVIPDFALRVKGLCRLMNRKSFNYCFKLFRLRMFSGLLLIRNVSAPAAPFLLKSP